jgi:uncharacterized protein involved in exopolysaccharide biosynthesis
MASNYTLASGEAALLGEPAAFADPVAAANRRRLRVFLAVFLLASLVGIAWVLLQPAQYRAEARLQIRPATAAVSPAPVAAAPERAGPAPQRVEPAAAGSPFLTEVQVLGSRPVLEQAVARLAAAGHDLGALGPDPTAALQQQIRIEPVSGTQVVELVATGGEAALLAPALNAVVEAYREHVAATYRSTSSSALADAEDEARRLDATVADKLAVVEAFRERHNIVSIEREENQVLARVKGLAASLNTANEAAATAEGKLRSLQESIAAGRAVVRARDNPTLANLEQRASMIREELRELERSYTADYIALDPRMRAQRDRLAELERQIAGARREGEAAALAEAEEAAASARETAERLRRQAAADQQEVQRFTARFNEYKALQDQLVELQGLQRAAAQRVTLLQASELGRMPAVQLLEAAVPPTEVWRPRYLRDAALGVAGAFLLGLLAMGFVELFNRRPPPPPILVVAQPIAGMPYPAFPAAAATLGHGATPTLAAAEPALLTAQPALPRELDADELAALLAAATDDARLAILLLLHGLTGEEARALGWDGVDLARRTLSVGGESARTVPLQDALADCLARRPAAPGQPLLADAAGLDANLLCAAHDAGVDEPAEVTAAALRHTYVAFLVRQGIRFADLAQLVGRLPADLMAAYSRLAPAGPRLPLEAIERVMPKPGTASA